MSAAPKLATARPTPIERRRAELRELVERLWGPAPGAPAFPGRERARARAKARARRPAGKGSP